MHTINQSLAATILRLMRSRSWPISIWRWERLILRRSMRAFCSAMLADRSTSHWTQRDFSASRSLRSTPWQVVVEFAAQTNFLDAEGRMLVARPDVGRCPQHWRPPGAPGRRAQQRWRPALAGSGCVTYVRTLSQPRRASIAAEHDDPTILEVASVEHSVQNRDGRPASDPPRQGNSSEPQIRQIFQDVDGSDLEALKSLCVQWEVDMSASMAEQNARIDQGSIDANSVAPSTRRKWASCATASSARWSPPG